MPQTLKEESIAQKQNITKELYGDYRTLRLLLFENIVQNNADTDKLRLLELTQKLLDRLVFIFFAEDTGLLPINSIAKIIDVYKKDWESKPLYHFYKLYFRAIDEGNARVGIHIGYNGELFKKDDELDSLKIDDRVLDESVLKLSNYDFESEIGVNILGHIFENSLNELEELKAAIEKGEFDKNKTKRKKEGVFYTPEYVTKYIIDATLGKICAEYKAAHTLEVKEELDSYRAYLLSLKIIDPACGSGAFLNQALEFLIEEHKALNRLYEALALSKVSNSKKAKVTLFDFDNQDEYILQNNLYGVDINGEAVEITKLSLWLRTAKEGHKLVSLTDNIKIANSLTDMPFALGSFDVVVGNPPYIRQESIRELKPLLQEHYAVYDGKADIFVYFYELAYKLLKDGGLNGFICSNKFFKASYGEALRSFILEHCGVIDIKDFSGTKVFEDAIVDSAITVLQKDKACEAPIGWSLSTERFVKADTTELEIMRKIETHGVPLKEWDVKINYGIKTGLNEAFIIDSAKRDELIAKDKKSEEVIKPLLRGRDVKRYEYEWAGLWLIATFPSLNINIDKYPAIKGHLESFGKKLEQSGEEGCRKKTGNKWFETQDQIAYWQEFEKEKLIYPDISEGLDFTLDTKGRFLGNTVYFVNSKSKYILAMLNSKATNFWYKKVSNSLGESGSRGFKIFVERIPIPKISDSEQKPFIELVDKILTAKEQIKKYRKHYESLNAKDKIEINEEIEKLQASVKESESAIDEMVFRLYGLSEGEIKSIS